MINKTFEMKDNPAQSVTVTGAYFLRGIFSGKVVKTIMINFVCPDGSIGSMDNDTFRQFYRSSKG